MDKKMEPDVVKSKDYVILNRGEEYRIYQLPGNKRPIRVFNCTIDFKNVLGNPFGATYKMIRMRKDQRLYSLDLCVRLETQLAVEGLQSGFDNSNIQDDNNSQTLNYEDIRVMKEDGLSSDDILHNIIKNSASFQKKTEYSQEKYVKKKRDRHDQYVRVLKPTIRLISDVLWKTEAIQICHLRWDSLAQIATAVNFRPTGRYLVHDTCQGLVLASMLNLTHSGTIISINVQNQPVKRRALNAMPFGVEKMRHLVQLDLSSILTNVILEKPVKRGRFEDSGPPKKNLKMESVDKSIDTMSEEDVKCNHNKRDQESKSDEDQILNSDTQLEIPHSNEGIHKSRCLARRIFLESQLRMLREEKADGLVIAGKIVCHNVLNKLIPFVRPSGNIVVFSPFQEPLVTAYAMLRKRTDVIFVRLFENWLRSYQVLEGRTHPDITMSGTGGYLLTAIVVQE